MTERGNASGSAGRVRADVGRVAWVLLALALAGSAVLLASGHLYIIRTGSMTPAIRAGDAVLARPVSRMPRVGDIIVYEAQGQIVTHRVVEVGSAGIVTKGDANDAPDPWVITRSQVRGRVALRLPYLGWVLVFLREPIGWLALVVAPTLAFVIVYGRRTIRAARDWRSGSQQGASADGVVADGPFARFPGDAFVYPTRGRHRGDRGNHRSGHGRMSGGVAISLLMAAAALSSKGSLAYLSATADGTMSVTTGLATVSATVDVKPETLQLESHGGHVLAFVRLSDGDTLAIDTSTVRLCVGDLACGEGGIPATDPMWTHGGTVLKVRFSRDELVAQFGDVTLPAEVVLSVSGAVGRTQFLGSDIIRVIDCDPCDHPPPGS